MAPDPPHAGVVVDVDDLAGLAGLRHPLVALWRATSQTGADRTPGHGVPGLVRHLSGVGEGSPPGPVVYLCRWPGRLLPRVRRALHARGLPPGRVLVTTDPGGDLPRVLSDGPHRWYLVGDDTEDLTALFLDSAGEHPARVAAVLLRQTAPHGGVRLTGPDLVDRMGEVPVVRAPDGGALRSRLQEREDAEPADPAVAAWLLSAHQLGNDRSRVPLWCTGNLVEPLVHGRTYFPALLEALAATGEGDLVMLCDWRGDPDERLTDDGPTVVEALAAAADRGAVVKGLLWRSHWDRLQFSSEQNRNLSEGLVDHGAEVLLDQRVRPLGSHHQKVVVIRHRDDSRRDVAFVGGIDLAHSRRDDADHGGDPQEQVFADPYGGSPAWHDVQVRLRGPVVRAVEDTVRERWQDPAVLSRLPWHVVPDLVRGTDRDPDALPPPRPEPPPAGSATVQLLRTYPNRWPGYPFAPDGERTAARGYAKALQRAERLVYVEDQYLWSTDVARVFAAALHRCPRLHLVAVVPRFPDQDGRLAARSALLGHVQALEVVRSAGGDRVHVLDVENRAGEPVYVHAKVCVVDDVWATVGSDNFNRRSWTHDSELTAAVLDGERDEREPRDPGGRGDGARRFARDLRLRLWREHLDTGDDTGLLDPDEAVATLTASAARLDAWHEGGRQGARPPGRLRPHRVEAPPRGLRLLASPLYRTAFDPDGRPPRMRWRGLY
ncbi:phospholipase D family protein [Aquipuribacter nitratireducens]|uniref:Phospholipase D family protein n=1 Tax=Aquipuribacter nitratireducens TaxID=650104 RepID=A0ABW0GJH7_9MICO